MTLIDSVKRAPRWAWFVTAGIGAGAVAIRVWQDRDNEEDTEMSGTEVGSPDYAGPNVSGGYPYSPTPVITPPVIIGGEGGDDGGIAQVIDVFGTSFDQLVGSLTGVTLGQQGLVGQGMQNVTDIATAAIAGAGSAPAPAAPTPIYVMPPAPAPAATPRAPAPPAPKRAVDTCHSAYNKDGNCWTCSRTKYSDGSWGANFDCHKVHNGKCGRTISCG